MPIAYGPRQKFLERINQRPDLEEERVAIQLPRMSFSYDTPLYDSERQRNKRTYVQEGRDKIKSPAPYRIPFQLSIYSKNEDEALQIIEQILPYFSPSIGVKMKPVSGMDFTDEIIFSYLSANKEDNYEGSFEDRRVLIYTLTFEARVNLYRNTRYFGRYGSDNYGDIQDRPVIKNVTIKNIDEDEVPFDGMKLVVTPQSAGADDLYEIICEDLDV